MGQCRVCKLDGFQSDGICGDCYKYQHIMQQKPVLFKPKTKMVLGKKALEARRFWKWDKHGNDRQFRETTATTETDHPFWRRVLVVGDDGKMKLSTTQRFNPFFQVPSHDKGGAGSFIVGTLKGEPVKRKRKKRDSEETYDTYQLTIATKVDFGNGRFIDVIFTLEDMNIGRAVAEMFPAAKIGQVPVLANGHTLGVVYMTANGKGYWEPDVYIDKSLTAVLDEMNTEILPQLASNAEFTEMINGGFKFSHTCWTPSLMEYLSANKIGDDIPF